MRILLVEDDTVLADGLTHVLGQSGYTVTTAPSGAYAESALLTQNFDLAILDLGLPDMEGCELLRRLRARKNSIPVLVLTARDALEDRIKGLEWGADDYMVKPFDLRELEARIHALLRRRYGGFGELKVGRLVLDTQNRQLMVDGEPIILSAREYGVLEALLIHAGRVVSKDRIAQRLSAGNEELGDNAIEVYIHRLRKRMETFGVKIRTVRGLGYLLEKDIDG
ncbi:response regulator [Methylocaldum szegediense]|uniref:Response regulator protein PmrA n=1 Tax=Methylocaldum szegediense TaxID=73780 RepID=A0ABM9I8R3_9GAMM|nr:response regulator transcription factor [Methylocaldum szegediense]CAI8960445.1 Response regulator protein PmrA [Methylocaldum szegediense]